jgi:hypothetical protein
MSSQYISKLLKTTIQQLLLADLGLMRKPCCHSYQHRNKSLKK